MMIVQFNFLTIPVPNISFDREWSGFSIIGIAFYVLTVGLDADSLKF